MSRETNSGPARMTKRGLELLDPLESLERTKQSLFFNTKVTQRPHIALYQGYTRWGGRGQARSACADPSPQGCYQQDKDGLEHGEGRNCHSLPLGCLCSLCSKVPSILRGEITQTDKQDLGPLKGSPKLIFISNHYEELIKNKTF